MNNLVSEMTEDLMSCGQMLFMPFYKCCVCKCMHKCMSNNSVIQLISTNCNFSISIIITTASFIYTTHLQYKVCSLQQSQKYFANRFTHNYRLMYGINDRLQRWTCTMCTAVNIIAVFAKHSRDFYSDVKGII